MAVNSLSSTLRQLPEQLLLNNRQPVAGRNDTADAARLNNSRTAVDANASSTGAATATVGPAVPLRTNPTSTEGLQNRTAPPQGTPPQGAPGQGAQPPVNGGNGVRIQNLAFLNETGGAAPAPANTPAAAGQGPRGAAAANGANPPPPPPPPPPQGENTGNAPPSGTETGAASAAANGTAAGSARLNAAAAGAAPAATPPAAGRRGAAENENVPGEAGVSEAAEGETRTAARAARAPAPQQSQQAQTTTTTAAAASGFASGFAVTYAAFGAQRTGAGRGQGVNLTA